MPRTLLLSLLASLPLSAQLIPSNLDKRITIPKGLTLNRFADQNQVQNATAICIDSQNRVYIAETNRWRVQVQDIRHGGRFLRIHRASHQQACRAGYQGISDHKIVKIYDQASDSLERHIEYLPKYNKI